MGKFILYPFLIVTVLLVILFFLADQRVNVPFLYGLF